LDIDATATEGRIFVGDDEEANVLPLKPTPPSTSPGSSRFVTTAVWITSAWDAGSPGVLVLVADLHVRVLTEDGELLRELTLDPSRDYQPKNGST
jgi:hypothetical protein